MLLNRVNKWEDDFLSTAVYIMIVFTLFMMIADACVLLAAVTVFVKPLEDMAHHLKMRGANIDLDHLRQLARRKKFIWAMLVSHAMTALLLLIAVA
jgi:uncharacterized membrane protein YhaH (DUF805 family)